MNNSARLVSRKPKKTHVTPQLRSLDGLPVKQRIDYKIAVMHFKCIHKQALSCLPNLLEIHQPRKSLRSSKDTNMLRVPRVNLKTYGERSFSYYGPVTWNEIPISVRHSTTLEIFKMSLKTFLFQNF
ncbi:reverse transcriptase-like protein [Elysia marginata]|uniref:Reverse transcriptase-like protein n=1 Tax=Elysia marginata TaxID=1093978 RepID=A0AAV4GKW1_9GAST|nr:reverse transcriptase-like protein [Elysia marginata]